MSAALCIERSPEAELDRQGAAAFVLSLRARGIFDINVLRAMETVPRDFFAPRRFADLARSDVALPIACGQTMTAPGMVAGMLVALDVRPGQRVLEIGTGSGYVTGLLARIGAIVHSIERQPILAETAGSRLSLAGFGPAVQLECGDGLAGGRGDAHFDRILVNGIAPGFSSVLTSRLRAGGRLVGALWSSDRARLVTIAREQDGRLCQKIGSPMRLSPLMTSENVKAENRPGNGCLT